MAIEIVMPKLGWTMEEGVLAEWVKQDGEQVKIGEILFTVESDKALQEVEAFDEGVLRIPPDSPAPGSIIKVGGLIAYLLQPGERAPFEQAGTIQPISPTGTEPASPSTPTPIIHPLDLRQAFDSPVISPRARRIAGEL